MILFLDFLLFCDFVVVRVRTDLTSKKIDFFSKFFDRILKIKINMGKDTSSNIKKKRKTTSEVSEQEMDIYKVEIKKYS